MVVHALPSQLNTKVYAEYPELPTAIHDDALTHDTDVSTSPPTPVLGLVTGVHVVPFHDNTNDESLSPTATHDDAVTHETEFN